MSDCKEQTPMPPSLPGDARGDGWWLRCGDCLDPETGLGQMVVDAGITDIPYAKETTRNTVVNPWANEEKTTEQRDVEMIRIGGLEDGILATRKLASSARRWLVVFSDAESHHLVRAAAEAGGHEYIRFGFWRKPDSMPQISGDRPAVGGEACTITHAPGRKRWNGGGTHAFWTFGTVKGSQRPGHPTPKPLPLMERLVLDFTDPGDLVCDPFAGSGTTAIACLKHGRRFIGWEKDPDFFDVAARRIESRPAKVEGQSELFAGTRGGH